MEVQDSTGNFTHSSYRFKIITRVKVLQSENNKAIGHCILDLTLEFPAKNRRKTEKRPKFSVSRKAVKDLTSFSLGDIAPVESGVERAIEVFANIPRFFRLFVMIITARPARKYEDLIPWLGEKYGQVRCSCHKVSRLSSKLDVMAVPTVIPR